MDRESLLELWSKSWDGDIWIAPWGKACADLTPPQAAWTPAPDRHSIWQIVNHVAFWREYSLAEVGGRDKPDAARIEREQFAPPTEVTAAAWSRACDRLEASHRAIGAAIATPTNPLERLKYHLAHDSYHLGQIMLLRALQGLPPIL